MKRIEAIIRPFKLGEVTDALLEAGIQGLTVYEARGFGAERFHTDTYRGSEYHVELLPKMILLVYAPDEQVPTVVDIIVRETASGKVGDGKIAILPVEEILRIRTGERGDEAI